LLYDPDKLDDRACEALELIKDEDGDWVKPPKYFTMPGLDKGKIFYNYDWARQSNMVVVCEGVFDAIAVGRCAVAAFGKGLTDEQVNMLRAYWDLVVVLLDPGDAEKEMIALSKKLPVNTLYMMLRGYKDAGEAPREEIWRQIDMAVQQNPDLASGGRGLETYHFVV
jgi:DNA primase